MAPPTCGRRRRSAASGRTPWTPRTTAWESSWIFLLGRAGSATAGTARASGNTPTPRRRFRPCWRRKGSGCWVSGGITPTIPLRRRRSGLSTSPGGNERWGNLSGPFRKTAWLSATPWIPPIWWGRWSGIIKQARWSPPPRGGFLPLPPSWVRCSKGQKIQLPCASRPAAPPVR